VSKTRVRWCNGLIVADWPRAILNVAELPACRFTLWLMVQLIVSPKTAYGASNLIISWELQSCVRDVFGICTCDMCADLDAWP
jgi:hypothetical protein